MCVCVCVCLCVCVCVCVGEIEGGENGRDNSQYSPSREKCKDITNLFHYLFLVRMYMYCTAHYTQ